jgi:hypothetical protein
MFSVNPATHAQEHNTLFSLESFDSAAQCLAFPMVVVLGNASLAISSSAQRPCR